MSLVERLSEQVPASCFASIGAQTVLDTRPVAPRAFTQASKHSGRGHIGNHPALQNKAVTVVCTTWPVAMARQEICRLRQGGVAEPEICRSKAAAVEIGSLWAKLPADRGIDSFRFLAVVRAFESSHVGCSGILLAKVLAR